MPFQPSGRPYSAGAQWGGILGNATAGLGEGVGKGIQQGLDFLAHEKMLHMQGQHASRQRERERQEVARGYERDFGKESAMNLAYRSPKEREILLSNPEYVQYLQSIRNQGNSENGINALTAQQPNRQQEIARMAQESGITPEQIAQILNPMGRQTSPEAQQMAQARDMQQPAQQQQPSAQFLANAYTPAANRIQNQKLNIAKQALLNPDIKEIKQKAETRADLVNEAEGALELVNSNKAITGASGKFVPGFLQTPEGQRLEQKLNRIVLLSDAVTPGRSSVLKLELGKGSKSQIWHHPETMKSALDDIINNPIGIYTEERGKATEDLLQKYGENWPQNLVSEIDKQARSQSKVREKEITETKQKESQQKAAQQKFVGPAAEINGQPYLWVEGKGYLPAIREGE